MNLSENQDRSSSPSAQAACSSSADRERLVSEHRERVAVLNVRLEALQPQLNKAEQAVASAARSLADAQHKLAELARTSTALRAERSALDGGLERALRNSSDSRLGDLLAAASRKEFEVRCGKVMSESLLARVIEPLLVVKRRAAQLQLEATEPERLEHDIRELQTLLSATGHTYAADLGTATGGDRLPGDRLRPT